MKTCLLILLCLLLPGLAGARADAAFKAGEFTPARMAPDFVLDGSDGKPFTLSAYRGKLVVLEFGFSHCTEVCPVSLAALSAARRQMGAAAADMQVVFVTVDPERDSVPRLHSYLAAFDPAIIGVTGSVAQLAKVRKDYGINASRHMMDGGKGDYTMSHSSYLYFIDRKGMLRTLMPFGRPVADIVHDASLLLKQ